MLFSQMFSSLLSLVTGWAKNDKYFGTIWFADGMRYWRGQEWSMTMQSEIMQLTWQYKPLWKAM
jgi:hypothetical protein